MRYYKTLGQSKASNLVIDWTRRQAWSYGWWQFWGVFGGISVFNSYGYSPSTIRHQWKTRRELVQQPHLTPALYLEVPSGLQDPNWIGKTVEHYQQLIVDLQEAIGRPRSRRKTNLARMELIGEYSSKIKQLQDLSQVISARAE